MSNTISSGCPFCNSYNCSLLYKKNVELPTACVICNNCGAQGPYIYDNYNNKDLCGIKAVKAWNNR